MFIDVQFVIVVATDMELEPQLLLGGSTYYYGAQRISLIFLVSEKKCYRSSILLSLGVSSSWSKIHTVADFMELHSVKLDWGYRNLDCFLV